MKFIPACRHPPNDPVAAGAALTVGDRQGRFGPGYKMNTSITSTMGSKAPTAKAKMLNQSLLIASNAALFR